MSKFISIILSIMMVLTSLTACGAAEAVKADPVEETSVSETSAPAETTAPTEEADPFDSLTGDDIAMFIIAPEGEDEDTSDEEPVTGLRTIYVLEGTKEFYPTMAFFYDDTVVTGIEADDAEVDYSATGTYEVTYEVSVNRDAFEAFTADPEAHKFHFVPAYIDPADDTKDADTAEVEETEATEEEDYIVVTPSEDDAVITVTDEVIVVVTMDEAEAKAEAYVPVYTDNGDLAVESVAEALPTPEAMSEAAEAETTAYVHQDTQTPAPAETQSSTPSQSQTEAQQETPAQTQPEAPVVTPEPVHTHSYSTTAEPTCTSNGIRTCSCGAAESIPALGHNYSNGTCTRCGASDPSYNPCANGHSFVTTSEPSCTNAGTRTCSVCGATESISALGHDWHEEAYGHLAPLCNECGYQASSTDDYYSHAFATGHNGYNCGSVVDGYHNVCSRCGAVQ